MTPSYRSSASLGLVGLDKPFLDGEFGGRLLLHRGLSRGGQILLEILSQRRDICRFALVESAAVVPSGLTGSLIRPAFGLSYGLIRKKRFAKRQFHSLHIRSELFDEYYRDTCAVAKKDMIAFLQASALYSVKDSLRECIAAIHIFYGEKEIRRIRISAETLRAVSENSTLHPLPGLFHGEFSLNRAEDYASAVRDIVKRRQISV